MLRLAHQIMEENSRASASLYIYDGEEINVVAILFQLGMSACFVTKILRKDLSRDVC
jgi:hypothetical protein